MKILLVSRRWYPDVIGGGQISAHQIARALVAATQDVRVLAFTTEGKRKDETIDGVRITRMPIRKLALFPRLSNLEWMYREMRLQTLAFLSEFSPDVIHAMNGESVPSIAAVSRTTSIPFVASVNGPWLFCFTGEGTDHQGNNCIGCRGAQRFRETMLTWGNKGVLSKLKAFAFWLYSYPHMALLSRSSGQASKLLPISDGFRQDLLRLGFADDNVAVVHNPIDVHPRVRSDLKHRLKLPADTHILFYAGRLAESKGVQHILDAMHDLPHTALVIAGKGDYEKELRRRVQELGLNSRVRFVGFVPNDQLGPYYSIANIVIMAGTFYESLGRMLMEACTYGVPVIGTNRGGIPDVIEDGKNGILLKTQRIGELKGAITTILDSPALAKKMGAYGKAKMKKEFSSTACVKKLVPIYTSSLHLHNP
jgi:glycosyltransferase involved in cell wall biosynthesis